MKKAVYIVLSIFYLSILTGGATAAQQDAQGCKDHPLFTRMPEYWIHSCTQKEFDSRTFTVGKDKTVQVEGRYWAIRYYPQSGGSKPSDVQILRNFENAVRKLGGTVVASDKGKELLRLTRDGKEVWVEVWADFTGKYGLNIVEKETMAQDIVANAAALSNDLRTTGHTALYGIYFDTGKSEIKPESEQAIGEIAKLLKNDASLKVYVVGHTDNVGGMDANMKLSQARSDAVAQALISKHSIDSSRLKAHGAGPFAPVASNDTEEGRAKNRRVELVKQ